jgi:diaminohydroxyphosphoribosylaminopyrimidine deaminase/5-amino-6-(5-phosphoribosylamino)uracil reductase
VVGGGIEELRRAGLEVLEGLEGAAASQLLSPFTTWATTGLPEVLLKAAVSLDGRLATSAGASHGMSGSRSLCWLHRLRDRVDAIMVGVGTVLQDNPRLTPRRPPLGHKGSHPLVRVIVDTQLRTPPQGRLLASEDRAHPVWVMHAPDAPHVNHAPLLAAGARLIAVPRAAQGPLDLLEVLRALGREGILTVLAEGGSRLHGSLLTARLATRILAVVTPRLLGEAGRPLAAFPGDARLSEAIGIEGLKVRRLGADTLLEGVIRYPRRGEGEPR